MKITNINELCKFISKDIKCSSARCTKCPLFNRFIKLEGELNVVCKHEWSYNFPSTCTISRVCNKCSSGERIDIPHPDKLNALFED